jgi:hypothetical protein
MGIFFPSLSRAGKSEHLKRKKFPQGTHFLHFVAFERIE